MPSDVRFALRQLAKSPGFAFVAVATLALGIGACAVMFSILDAVLLRPLPFRDPDRLVWIENNLRKDGLSGRTTRADVFSGWRENSRSFEALGAYFAFFDYERLTLTGGGEPLRLRGVGVSDNFLAVLGVPLLHGRSFTAEECTGKGPRAVILTNGFWQRRFGSDPSVVGRSLALNDAPYTVIGVLPATSAGCAPESRSPRRRRSSRRSASASSRRCAEASEPTSFPSPKPSEGAFVGRSSSSPEPWRACSRSRA